VRAAIALIRHLSVFAFLLLLAAPQQASAETHQLVYKITHSKYGNIGTYTNTIDTEGPNATVTTQSNITVKVLGIVAHRESANRVEKWSGDKLVYFHAVSNINGKQATVDGTAQGDQFAIMTPSGPAMAPALIRVANPWSPKTMNGDTMLTPDDGVIHKVQISAGEDTTVSVNGQEVPAKLYTIDLTGTNKRYQVWFDSSGTAVKFNQIDKDGTVTFTLTIQRPGNELVAQKQPGSPSPSP
jgi:uncharacterized Zn-binding protein involved in type VI secretion